MTFQLSDQQIQRVENLIRETATTCIEPYFQNLSTDQIRFKDSEFDPVSVADTAAEEHLKIGLTEVEPSSLFIGEETYALTPECIAHIQEIDRPVWVVDPIDGTANFVSGDPGFGIMVALVFQNKVLYSWLYEIPKQNLVCKLFAGPVLINGAVVPIGNQTSQPYIGQVGRKLYALPGVQKLKSEYPHLTIDPGRDPSIIKYQLMVEGRLDFLVFQVTMPWDHLPGYGLLAEQGMSFLRWDGTPYELTDTNKGLVVARNEGIAKLVLETIVKAIKNPN